MSVKPFVLTFDPVPSRAYPNGYWHCYAEPGYDASAATVEGALAACLVEMSRALCEAEEVQG